MSMSDNSGTTLEAGEKSPPDRIGRTPRASTEQSSVTGAPGIHAFHQLISENIERCLIGSTLCFDYGIEGLQSSKNLRPYDLPQPAFESIARNGCVAVLRNDESDTRMTQRGSENPDLEMLGPNTLPLSPYLLNVRALREPMAPREGKPPMRQRTSSGA
jgi:hypothetical protein